jgi:hypothetical protein
MWLEHPKKQMTRALLGWGSRFLSGFPRHVLVLVASRLSALLFPFLSSTFLSKSFKYMKLVEFTALVFHFG